MVNDPFGVCIAAFFYYKDLMFSCSGSPLMFPFLGFGVFQLRARHDLVLWYTIFCLGVSSFGLLFSFLWFNVFLRVYFAIILGS